MSSQRWELAGKTVLITGAARGIGAESACRLAACGMKVALVGLEPEQLARVAGQCGPDAVWFEADVTDREQLQAAVEGTVAQLDGVDVGVGYFSWIDTEMVRGADRHPALGAFRGRLSGAVRRTYPVTDVGDAVVAGFERRSSWIGVPAWLVRVARPLRGLLPTLTERASGRDFAELEAAFERDVAERGATASQPVGAGGEAVTERAATSPARD